MPQNKFAFARYRIIDALLSRHDYVKTSVIVDACFARTGFRVSRRTVQMDIEAMRFDPFLGFDAPIDYCPRRRAWFYSDADYRLNSFSFTPTEMAALERLLAVSSDDDRELLRGVVEKLRAMADGEIKVRHPVLNLS